MPILHVVVMLALLAALAIFAVHIVWWAVLVVFALCLLIIGVLYRPRIV